MLSRVWASSVISVVCVENNEPSPSTSGAVAILFSISAESTEERQHVSWDSPGLWLLADFVFGLPQPCRVELSWSWPAYVAAATITLGVRLANHASHAGGGRRRERGEISAMATREQPEGLSNEHALRAHDAGERRHAHSKQ